MNSKMLALWAMINISAVFSTDCLYMGTKNVVRSKYRETDVGQFAQNVWDLMTQNTCKNLQCTKMFFSEDVTKIVKDAFKNCKSLVSIAISSNVTEIGENAFEGCTNLTSVHIPASVEYIGRNAFANCTGLISVSFDPNMKLEKIEMNTFANCSSLTSIHIPNSVTGIECKAFRNCVSLTSLTLPFTVKNGIEVGAFENCKKLTNFDPKYIGPCKYIEQIYDVDGWRYRLTKRRSL